MSSGAYKDETIQERARREVAEEEAAEEARRETEANKKRVVAAAADRAAKAAEESVERDRETTRREMRETWLALAAKTAEDAANAAEKTAKMAETVAGKDDFALRLDDATLYQSRLAPLTRRLGGILGAALPGAPPSDAVDVAGAHGAADVDALASAVAGRAVALREDTSAKKATKKKALTDLLRALPNSAFRRREKPSRRRTGAPRRGSANPRWSVPSASTRWGTPRRRRSTPPTRTISDRWRERSAFARSRRRALGPLRARGGRGVRRGGTPAAHSARAETRGGVRGEGGGGHAAVADATEALAPTAFAAAESDARVDVATTRRVGQAHRRRRRRETRAQGGVRGGVHAHVTPGGEFRGRRRRALARAPPKPSPPPDRRSKPS